VQRRAGLLVPRTLSRRVISAFTPVGARNSAHGRGPASWSTADTPGWSVGGAEADLRDVVQARELDSPAHLLRHPCAQMPRPPPDHRTAPPRGSPTGVQRAQQHASPTPSA